VLNFADNAGALTDFGGNRMKQRQMGMWAALLTGLFLSACAPEVGSERWCKNMAEKPKGDWSANEATDYARHCLFKSPGQD